MNRERFLRAIEFAKTLNPEAQGDSWATCVLGEMAQQRYDGWAIAPGRSWLYDVPFWVQLDRGLFWWEFRGAAEYFGLTEDECIRIFMAPTVGEIVKQMEKAFYYPDTLEVTQEHINSGVCNQPQQCALAQAFHEIRPINSVSVDGGTVRLFSQDGVGFIRLTLSSELREWVVAFDRNKAEKPITLKLDWEAKTCSLK